MKIKLVGILVLLVMVISLVAAGCSGQAANAPSGDKSMAAPAEPEKPVVNIPTVEKSQKPVIKFTASPASIAPGGTAVLSWDVTNATSVTIDHSIGAVQAKGTKNVSPASSTTYKLTAVNDTANATATISVAVVQASAPATTTKPATK